MRKIAIIPGDGYGPDITDEAVKVLHAIMDRSGLDLQLENFDISVNKYLKAGIAFSDEEIEDFRNDFDAIFIGALGEPQSRNMVYASEILLELISKLDLYVNYRPVKLLNEKYCPLKNKKPEDVNFMIFRHNLEGVNSDVVNIIRKGTPDEEVFQQCIISRKGIQQIVQFAFDFARRQGHKKMTICCGRKYIKTETNLWFQVFDELGQDYSDIQKDTSSLEDLVRHLLKSPEHFEIIITCNTFGDILTDLGTELQGGTGLAVEANLHPGRISLYMPVQGSSSDDIEKNTASPLAAISAVGLMLEHLGFEQEANWVNAALKYALDTDNTTRQLGGRLETKQVGDFITDQIKRGHSNSVHS